MQIVIETSGSEPKERLQYQLATILSGFPAENILIFSDLEEEEVGAFRIRDALADVSVRECKEYSEFAVYDELQMYLQEGRDTHELKGGYKLARYKNMAIKRMIWKMLGAESSVLWRRKWYVFIDMDTFIEWNNLLVLLEHLNPMNHMYIGSPVWGPTPPFAHGGSGYVFSYKALETLNMPGRDGNEELMYSQYGVNTTALCCGDEALSIALKRRGIDIRGYWPLFNGDPPVTINFEPEMWCEPVISLHHVTGADMEDLWRWVENWKSRTTSMQPFLFRDLFEYVALQLVHRMHEWDNTDDGWKIFHQIEDTKKGALASFKQCSAACEADNLCFQFVVHGTTCALSHNIRAGRKRVPDTEGGYQYISGWNLQRIQDWTTKMKCTSAHWVHSNP
ncbi:hypothetical protein EAE96_001246 [Botrytis aclada]|nr:hypothetical protein EAE96_001246 [Botrytis aclada]